MENRLKEATQGVIQKLNECNIRTIMATGDNTLTAISVGRECNILNKNHEVFFCEVQDGVLVWNSSTVLEDEDTRQSVVSQRANSISEENSVFVKDSRFDVPWDNKKIECGVALNGSTLAFLIKNKETYGVVLYKILFKAQVYARMSPDDKAALVELLQDTMQIQVGMCGDGANDCGALKQADAGISLSEAEASIAAPFTSKVQDISCVITLIREGRAALVTTF